MERITLGKVDTQLAAAYTVYMMVGSYFADCRCVNLLEEKRLFLHYRELNPEKQIRFENKAEEIFLSELGKAYADSHGREQSPEKLVELGRKYAETLGKYHCSVYFRRRGSLYVIRFYTGLKDMEFTVDPKGIMRMTW